MLAAAYRSFGLVGPGAEILRGWAGVYPSTPDPHPVIERTSHGYVTAAGFSGTGLMHAPAAGTLVREIVTEGAARSVDPREIDLTSARFRDGIDTVETSGF